MKKIVISLLLISFVSGACTTRKHNPDTDGSGSDAVAASQTPAAMPAIPNADAISKINKPDKPATGKIIQLTEEEFKQKITDINNPKGLYYKGQMPCIVDFYADWCRPCRELHPILVKIAQQYKGKLIVYQVNTDGAPNLCQAFEIHSIPTLLFFKQSLRPARINGTPSETELKAIIEQFLNEKPKLSSAQQD